MTNKLILGTVQFGLRYGINNANEKPTEKEVYEMLDIATENHIETLDTADAYGNATELIGNYHSQREHRFKILSKFKFVKQGELHNHVLSSLKKMNILQFEVYSYHSFDDYLNYTFLKEELLLLKDKGLIKKIGISVYTNIQFLKAIEDKNIDVIQIPYNILDNQNIRGAYINLAKKNNKEIHVRSVFLQGLLSMDEASIPERLVLLRPYLQKIKAYCKLENINLLDLALSYAYLNKNIDKVLIGIDNKDQLLNNLLSIQNNQKAFDFINSNIIVNETNLLNPVNWQ